ncbi:membrane metalloprotease [Gaetbulibacter jejuensis]|uniref:membrane metalloprotease n=1 Tax=Gaetbulibacter jejuensis TaxID=584607 RepID=UPI00300BEBA3
MKLIFIYALIIAFFTACSNDTNSNSGNNQPSIVSNALATGASANHILSNNQFKSMVIELTYIDGYAPSTTTINNLQSFLENRVNKPNGITIEQHQIVPPGNSNYTIDDIVAIENTHRINFNTNDKIAIWILFLDGEAASNTESSLTLGTAYLNTSFVVYENTIHDLSNSAFEPNRSDLETTVVLHEFGHLLGLTNLGTQMQNNHEDIDHPKHCNEENCLMYYAAETGSGVMNMVSGGTIPQLDTQCIADLQANGGK